MVIALAGVPAFGMEHSQPEPCNSCNNCKQSKADMAPQNQPRHDHQGHDGTGEKLQWQGMSRHMIPMMKTLTGMTQMLTDAMGTGMNDEKMGKLAGLMDALSTHMLRMFDMMNNRSATEGEMHTLHMVINETEAQMKKVK